MHLSMVAPEGSFEQPARGGAGVAGARYTAPAPEMSGPVVGGRTESANRAAAIVVRTPVTFVSVPVVELKISPPPSLTDVQTALVDHHPSVVRFATCAAGRLPRNSSESPRRPGVSLALKSVHHRQVNQSTRSPWRVSLRGFSHRSTLVGPKVAPLGKTGRIGRTTGACLRSPVVGLCFELRARFIARIESPERRVGRNRLVIGRRSLLRHSRSQLNRVGRTGGVIELK